MHFAHYEYSLLEPMILGTNITGKVAHYCWPHTLYHGLCRGVAEESRTTAWLREYYPELLERNR